VTTGFIGSHTVTHNYSVYALKLTTVHYHTCRIFTLYLHSFPVFQYRRIHSPATLELFSEDCCSARTLIHNWNCPRHSWTRNWNSPLSCQLTALVIAWERTTNKTLVASIVALLSNGYKQRFHCWLLTYSVHVTVSSLRPQPLPSTSFPNQYSLSSNHLI
jgi:hypothetical protein